MEFLASYFFNLRVGSEDAVTYGLYPKWSRYVAQIAHLLGHLSSRCVSAVDSMSKTCDKEQCMVSFVLMLFVVILFVVFAGFLRAPVAQTDLSSIIIIINSNNGLELVSCDVARCLYSASLRKIIVHHYLTWNNDF